MCSWLKDMQIHRSVRVKVLGDIFINVGLSPLLQMVSCCIKDNHLSVFPIIYPEFSSIFHSCFIFSSLTLIFHKVAKRRSRTVHR